MVASLRRSARSRKAAGKYVPGESSAEPKTAALGGGDDGESSVASSSSQMSLSGDVDDWVPSAKKKRKRETERKAKKRATENDGLRPEASPKKAKTTGNNNALESLPIFDVVADKKAALLPHVRRVLSASKQYPGSAASCLATFIVQTCGSEGSFSIELSDDSAVRDELEEHSKQILEECTESLLGGSSKDAAAFTKRYNRFWRDLMTSGSTEFSCETPLLGDLISFLVVLSGSKLGVFRYVAVATSMVLGEEILRIHETERGTFDKIKRQFMAQHKKFERSTRGKKSKLPSFSTALIDYVSSYEISEDDDSEFDSILSEWSSGLDDARDGRLIQLGRMCGGMAKRVRRLGAHAMTLFKAVVVHRYRDIHSPIRAHCISGFASWITASRKLFLNDKYTKYLGWSLNDKSDVVRARCLEALCSILQAMSAISPMRKFMKRFLPRISDMLLDKFPRVVLGALDVISHLHRLGVVGDDDDSDDDDEDGEAQLLHRAFGCIMYEGAQWSTVRAKSAALVRSIRFPKETAGKKQGKLTVSTLDMSTAKGVSRERINVLVDVIAEQYECSAQSSRKNKRAIVGSTHMHVPILGVVEAFRSTFDKPEESFLYDWEAIVDILQNTSGPKYSKKRTARSASSSIYGPVTRARIIASLAHACAKNAHAAVASVSSRQKRTKKTAEKLRVAVAVTKEFFSVVVLSLPSILKAHQSDSEVVESAVCLLGYALPSSSMSMTECRSTHKLLAHLKESFMHQFSNENTLLPIAQYLFAVSGLIDGVGEDKKTAEEAILLLSGMERELVAEVSGACAEKGGFDADAAFACAAAMRRLRVIYQASMRVNSKDADSGFIDSVHEAFIQFSSEEVDEATIAQKESILLIHALACTAVVSGTSEELLHSCREALKKIYHAVSLLWGRPAEGSAFDTPEHAAWRSFNEIIVLLCPSQTSAERAYAPTLTLQRLAGKRLRCAMNAFSVKMKACVQDMARCLSVGAADDVRNVSKRTGDSDDESDDEEDARERKTEAKRELCELTSSAEKHEITVANEVLIPFAQSCIAAAETVDETAASSIYRYFNMSTSAEGDEGASHVTKHAIVSEVVRNFHSDFLSRCAEKCLRAQLLALEALYDEASAHSDYFAVGSLADALGKSLAGTMLHRRKTGGGEDIVRALVQFAKEGIRFAFTLDASKGHVRIGFIDSISSYVKLSAKRVKESDLAEIQSAIDSAVATLCTAHPDEYDALESAKKARHADNVWESLFEFEQVLGSGENSKSNGKKGRSENNVNAGNSKVPRRTSNVSKKRKPSIALSKPTYAPLEMSKTKLPLKRLGASDDESDEEDDLEKNVFESENMDMEDGDYISLAGSMV